MKIIRIFTFPALLVILAFLGVAPAHAVTLPNLGNREAAAGLREALAQGAGKAVSLLGRTDGFLGNPRVKVPLPPGVDKASGMLRSLGMGRYADELEIAMNRAAETAVAEAKPLLLGAVRHMSIEDAVAILKGGDDAATRYFRRTTAEPLAQKFLPVVRKAMAKVKLVENYDRFAGKAARFGLVKAEDARLDDYVTRKALDGLYLMIAEEEKSIRADPATAVGRLARKVFGTLE